MSFCIDCGHPKKSRNGERCRPCGYLLIGRSNRERAWRAPSIVKSLTQAAAAWVGAMIEGEGSVFVGIDNRGYEDIDLHVYNSDVETIATMLRLVGDGNVYYRGSRLSSKWPGSGTKPQWAWSLQKKPSVRALLPQIIPFLTGKQDRARLALACLTPMAGGTCHPTHFEGPPDLVHNTPEQIEKNWEEFKRADKVDPRAIDKHFKFKPGHEPDYAEPESGEVYVKIEGHEGSDSEPDQLHMLGGSSVPSGIPCERCG